jgi:putative membrane protein
MRRAAAQQAPTSGSVVLGGNMTAAQLHQAALGGMAFALASSQVAVTRAETAPVRTFAGLEADEQTAFAEARRMVGLIPPSTAMLDAGQQQMLRQLQALRGAEFDRLYVQGQVLGHQELLVLHQQLAQSAPTREERALALAAIPGIRTHLAMLAGIQQAMRG